MKKILSILLAIVALSTLTASAQLTQKQVGSLDGAGNSQYYPIATQYTYGQSFTLYTAATLNIPEGTTIQSISYFGYQPKDCAGKSYKFSLYIAETELTTLTKDNNPYVEAYSGTDTYGDPTTLYRTNYDQMTYFGEYTWENPTPTGSTDAPETILTITSDEGFEYTGKNLLIFINAEIVPNTSSPNIGTYFKTFSAGTNGGGCAYRTYNYYTGSAGYDVSTKAYSYGTASTLPVMELGLAAGGPGGSIEYHQVGTIGAEGRNYPLYTMEKYSQGITLYTASTLGINAGTQLKSIGFMGFTPYEKTGVVNFKLYVAETDENTVNQYIVAGEDEGGVSTTQVDLSQMTYFGEYTLTNTIIDREVREVLTIESESGYTYTGKNLVLYMYMYTESGTYPSITFMQSTAPACIGAYRSSNYLNVGYSVFTKSWTYNSDNSVKAPVLNIGYTGSKIAVSATIKGQVVKSNTAALQGATVTFTDCEPQTTPSNGSFTFTIADVDREKSYDLTVSAEGYETYTRTGIDIKGGGTIELGSIMLTKLPVPANLSGKVIDQATQAPIVGATVTFNGITAQSGADGSYSIAVANLDDLSTDNMQITATASGYYPFSISYVIGAGDNTYDIAMTHLAALPGTGTQIGEWKELTDYSYESPFNPLWQYSAAQTIYPAAMFEGVAAGTKFGSISFYGYYPSPTAAPDVDDSDDDYDYGYGDYYGVKAKAGEQTTAKRFDITLYIVPTDKTNFNASNPQAIPVPSIAPAYEGTVSLSISGTKEHPVELFTLELDEPFEYEGGNVAFLVEAKALDGSCLPYFCIDTDYTANVIKKYASNEGSYSTATWSVPSATGNASIGVPVIKLGEYIPSAKVSGIVTDKATGEPIENVSVTISGNGYSSITQTDAEGSYTFTIRSAELGEPYTLSFEYGDYYDETETVTFTSSTLEQTINIEMEKPETTLAVAVSGTVTDAESGEALADVMVTMTLANVENSDVLATATTDSEGKYLLNYESAEADIEYIITFSLEHYDLLEEIVVFTANTTEQTIDVELEKEGLDGIEGIAVDFRGDIYNVQGMLVKRNATKDDVKSLTSGIYVINGSKYLIR